MSVSIKNGNQFTGNSASSRTKVQAAAAPSIRNIFRSGESSVRASSAATPASKTPSIDYITSSKFMQDLKTKLSVTGDDPAQYLRTQSMMGALERGHLQVSDPTQGKSINAWDPNQKNATPTTVTEIAKTNWVDFLNSQLKRTEDGAFSKDGSGSYVDKSTEKHAYFGRVAGKYYYVTWPTETKT